MKSQSAVEYAAEIQLSNSLPKSRLHTPDGRNDEEAAGRVLKVWRSSMCDNTCVIAVPQ
jgi:hypothetical protein